MKSLIGIPAIIYVWVNTNLSPLFWAVVLIAALDLILNIGKNEMTVILKLAKASFAVIVPEAFKNFAMMSHPGSYASIMVDVRVSIALILMIQLSTVVPEMFTQIKDLIKQIAPKQAKQIDSDILNELKAEVARLSASDKTVLKDAGITPSSSSSSTTTTGGNS